MPQTIYLGTYSQPKRINEVEEYNYVKLNPLPQLPITVDEFKSHARIDVPLEQNSYLNLIVKTAIRTAESYINLSLINTKWRTTRNNFDCDAFELRKGYFVSIEKFQYIDLITSLPVDVDTSIYYVAAKSYYALILLKMGQIFPYQNVSTQDNSINIEFTAGMAATSVDFENLYPDLKLALLQHCSFLYDNRGNDIAINADNISNSMPLMVSQVYDRYKDQSIFGGTVYNF